ncbi:protein-tyrosine phosphatase [Frigoribacterium faeni]|nr:protein-tyrosine phosphatase [Frigoribacterium faeni]
MSRFSVVFVCTGNICRSPMAEVVLRELAARAGHADSLVVSSSGTGDWHVGEGADPRTVQALQARGYDGSRHRASQFSTADFARHDLVVALDRGHERVLRSWAENEADRSKVQLLMSFDPEGTTRRGPDVPDPYYSDAAAFDDVLAMVERACTALFRQIEPALRKGPL